VFWVINFFTKGPPKQHGQRNRQRKLLELKRECLLTLSLSNSVLLVRRFFFLSQTGFILFIPYMEMGGGEGGGCTVLRGNET
jgi:hypothetical protein